MKQTFKDVMWALGLLLTIISWFFLMIGFGVIAKLAYNVFMVGWNLI